MEYYEYKLDPVGVRPDWLGDEFWFDNSSDDWMDWSDGGYGWHNRITAIRIPADHWAVPALKAGFTPWPGGDSAPADWDGGRVLQMDGDVADFDEDWQDWKRTGCSFDIIGYRRAAKPARDPVLVERFIEFARQEAIAGDIAAQGLIAELEPEPVDPLVEALEDVESWPPTAAFFRGILAKRGLKIVEA